MWGVVSKEVRHEMGIVCGRVEGESRSPTPW